MRYLLIPVLAACALGCDSGAANGPLYYDRVIQPIFNASCVRNQGSCHKDDGQGNALGNLDLTSYENVNLRRDVLRVYGSFPIPLLLLKGSAGASALPPIPYQGRTSQAAFLPSQIQHVGGPALGVQSNAFLDLQRWLE